MKINLLVPVTGYLLAALCVAGPLTAATYVWNVDANGNWNAPASWNPNTGFPNAIDDVATFDTKITSNRTVTVNQAVTVGGIVINDNNNYTISGSNAITFDTSGADASLTVQNAGGNGAHTVSAPLTLNKNLAITTNSSGALNITGAITGTGNLSITNNSTGLLTVSGLNTSTGNISVGGTGITQLTNATVSQNIVIASGATVRTANTNTYTGNVSGAGIFQKASSFGTVQFNGSFDGFTGTLMIDPGHIRFDRNAAWTGLGTGAIISALPTATFANAAGHGAFMGYTPANEAEMQNFISKFDSGFFGKVGFAGNFGDANTVIDLSNHPRLSLSAAPNTGDDAVFNGSIKVAAGQAFNLGGANTLTFTRTNALSGDHALVMLQGGTVRLSAAQNYTGGTQIGVSGFGSATIQFDYNPSIGSPFGTGLIQVQRGGVEAVGANGTFIGLTNTIDWQDNSYITFDNREAVNTNRYGDNTAINFTAGRQSLQLRGNLTSAVTEQVGDVTVGGGYTNIYAWVEYSATAADPTRTNPADTYLNIKSLTRGDNSSFVRISSVPNFNTLPTERPAGYLGDDARVIVTDPTAKAALVGQISNGMLPAYYVDPTANTFLTYDTSSLGGTEVGFTNAAFTSTDLLTATPTDIVTSGAATLTSSKSVQALRATGAINKTGTEVLTLTSGGLYSHIAANTTSTANLDFNNQRAYIHTSTSNFVHTLSGDITNAAGLTKAGNRRITLSGNLSGIVGSVVVAEGDLEFQRTPTSPQIGNGSMDLTVYAGATMRLWHQSSVDGTLDYTFSNLEGKGSVFYDSGANLRHGNLVINNTRDTVFEGNISSNGGTSTTNKLLNITKTGTGTLRLTSGYVGGNPFNPLGFNGTLTINQGLVLINANKTVASPIIVNSGGAFGGSGTIAGNVTVNTGGVLTPGDVSGTMTLTNGLDLADNSSLIFEAGDLISFTGTAARTISVGTSVDLTIKPGFGVGNYMLTDWSQVTGGVVTVTTTDAGIFDIVWPTTTGYSGQVVQLPNGFQLQVTAVPEPATFGALAGLATLLLVRLRNRRK